MSHDVHTNHFTSSEDPQPRAEDSGVDVTVPPMPDHAPTGNPTLNLENQSVETPNAGELRDMVHPDRKRSIIETVLNNRFKRWGAGVLLAASVIGGAGAGASAIYNAGKSAGSEQPAGDNHAGGDILNQQNNSESQYKDLENGKSTDLDHFKFIVGGKAMSRQELVHSNEIKANQISSPQEVGAQLVRSWELQVNSVANTEEAAKYPNYESLPKDKMTASSPRGLTGVYDMVYRPAFAEAMHLDAMPNSGKQDAYKGAYQFEDGILGALTEKQINDFAEAMKSGAPLPHMKISLLDIKRDTAAEQRAQGTDRAANQIYKITFSADNGTGDSAFVQTATYEFRPMSNDKGESVMGLLDVTNVSKGPVKRSSMPTPTATPTAAASTTPSITK